MDQLGAVSAVDEMTEVLLVSLMIFEVLPQAGTADNDVTVYPWSMATVRCVAIKPAR